MKRTLIERSEDGNLLFTLQSQVSNARITGDARKQRLAKEAGQPDSWQRVGRAIGRPGKRLPEQALTFPGVTGIFPMGTMDVIGQENADVAFVGVLHADAIVKAIDEQNAAFEIKPLAHYGHHPDPHIDAQVEMDRLEGLLAEARARVQATYADELIALLDSQGD